MTVALAPMRRRGWIAAALACLVAGTAAPSAEARRCAPVKNPYAGTRYEGVDLKGVRAYGVKCSRARRVARGAHRKALAATPSASGIVRVRWNGWRVVGDLRGASDRYVARRGGDAVRWRF